MNGPSAATDWTRKPWGRIGMWAGAALAGGVLVVELPVVSRVAWIRALLDLAHIPLGGLLTLAAWRLLGGSVGRAVLLVVVFTGVAEWLQGSVAHRTPDAADFLWGICGALMVPIWWFRGRNHHRAAATVLKLMLIILLLAAPMVIKMPALLDGWQAYRSFPVVWDARSKHAVARWVVRGGTLRREGQGDPPVIVADPTCGSRSLQLVQFPALGDWSEYETFCMEFRLQAAGEVLLSIRDGRKVQPPQRRFDDRRHLEAGLHCICFDLACLRRGDSFAPLDISRIRSIHLVLRQPSGAVELHRMALQ